MLTPKRSLSRTCDRNGSIRRGWQTVSFWNKRGGTPDGGKPAPAASARGTARSAGEYQLLHKYLRDRYADRVVLTFAEIEDLLGFALPGAARVQREWWAASGPTSRSTHSDSWLLASRTATVNLEAGCVAFDRDTSIV